jgi:PhnB protein
MTNRSIADHLDDAVETILRRQDAPLSPVDPELRRLQQIAADLLGMPDEDFRALLAAEVSGPETKVAGQQSITLYLTVRRAPELLAFVKKAFDAVEILRATGSAGGMHAEVRIGSSTVMIGGYESLPFEQPAILHLYVPDVDAVYRRALEAGGKSTHEPVDQPYGDREAGVTDPFGNQWYIATHAGASAIPEGLRSVTPYLHPRGTARFIGFLQKAFGAEELDRFRSPDGVIQHAKIRIGNSIVEMSEAHGPYQPMPPQFYLSVPDVDTHYEKALQAGAISIQAPADQPYGARTAAVTDPFGNVWYIATPIAEAAK